MHYITDDDHKKSKRHEELTKRLDDAQKEHQKINEDYYSGKASAEEVVQILIKLENIMSEWRSTMTTLKKSED